MKLKTRIIALAVLLFAITSNAAESPTAAAAKAADGWLLAWAVLLGAFLFTSLIVYGAGAWIEELWQPLREDASEDRP